MMIRWWWYNERTRHFSCRSQNTGDAPKYSCLFQSTILCSVFFPNLSLYAKCNVLSVQNTLAWLWYSVSSRRRPAVITEVSFEFPHHFQCRDNTSNYTTTNPYHIFSNSLLTNHPTNWAHLCTLTCKNAKLLKSYIKFFKHRPVWLIDVDVLIYYPLHVSIGRWPSSEGFACQHVGNVLYYYNVLEINLDFISHS
jgi:hypothetical protein